MKQVILAVMTLGVLTSGASASGWSNFGNQIKDSLNPYKNGVSEIAHKVGKNFFNTKVKTNPKKDIDKAIDGIDDAFNPTWNHPKK